MLGGAADRGVTGIEVHFIGIRKVTRNYRALKEMNVLHEINHPRDVVQILERRITVGAAGVDHADGGPGRAEIYLAPPGFHIVLPVLAMQHETACCPGDSLLDERRRE